MSDTQHKPWVCPWGLCNHQQAQECRAEKRPSKGCGGRFPPDMSPEQAAEEIKPRTSTPAGPFYISGPYPDGSYSICELATARIVQKLSAEEFPPALRVSGERTSAPAPEGESR